MGLPKRPPWRAFHQHLLNLATVDQPRLVAQLFTRRLQQPIIFREDVLPAKEFQGNNPIEITDWAQLPDLVQRATLAQRKLNSRGKQETNAYLVVYRPATKAPSSDDVPLGTEIVAEGDYFTILKLAR
jgi:hypothetical protein